MLKKTKKIRVRDLKVGDFIKSKDYSNTEVFKEVLQIMPSTVEVASQVRLLFKNGSTLECSDTHPIMVDRGSGEYMEVMPRDLHESDKIVSESSHTYLESISSSNNNSAYIDLTVEGTHTFFVANKIEEEMILTHNSQGAVRGASATFNYPIFHLEFENLIELKNNKGTHETRLPTVDYCIHINKTMYERLISRGNITFFSPDEVPDLYEAFYGPADAFKVLYEKYEADPKKTKKSLPALEVFTKIVSERFGTGRIYIMHADHVNTHSSLYESVYMVNLCVEITQHTTPMGNDESLIALCTLSAANWGKIKTREEMAEAAEMSIRGLDELLDYQNYPNIAAHRHTMLYRPLGVGIIGLAHDMVRNGHSWSNPESHQWIEDKMETMAYFLTKTSIDLAEEKGPCPRRTKYHDGIFPLDSAIGGVNPKENWDELRERAKVHGIRNATLSALMPSETSSQLANEVNGVESPKALITTKGSKDNSVSQVVPEIAKYNHAYELAWDIPVASTFEVMARLQKYIDQSISTNENYDPNKGKITVNTLIQNLVLAYKKGIKTLYYCNTNTDVVDTEDDCAGGACKI